MELEIRVLSFCIRSRDVLGASRAFLCSPRLWAMLWQTKDLSSVGDRRNHQRFMQEGKKYSSSSAPCGGELDLGDALVKDWSSQALGGKLHSKSSVFFCQEFKPVNVVLRAREVLWGVRPHQAHLNLQQK